MASFTAVKPGSSFLSGTSIRQQTASQKPRSVKLAARADAKDITFDAESRQKMQRGINKLASAVGVTIGPRGRNVVLQQKFGVPQVINDGVSIARAIELEDPVENAGAQLIKEVAGRTNDAAGDGTTTACVLAAELIKYGIQVITSGANPVYVKRGIDKTCNFLLEKLKDNARPVSGFDDIKSVAAISAGNDDFIGNLIAEALDKVGADGVLSIESSQSTETTVEVQEGMAIDRGFISPQFVNNPERQVCEFDNCRVLVADHKIETARQIIPILEQASKAGAPLVIICEDIVGEALATLVVNKMRGIINVVGVKAPGFGERRKALLQDIAIVTGAEYIAKDLGMNFEDTVLEQLGVARKVTVATTSTTIIAESGSTEEIAMRVAQIKSELARSDSIYDTEKLSERIAKLTGGIAVIKVGASTEAELEDRKLRIEDAKNATFAAVEEGIVPGGGAALYHLSKFVPAFRETLEIEEERMGADIVMKAMTAPLKKIAFNSGVDGEVIMEKLNDKPWEFGYNAMDGKIEDLIAAGILDPAKVTRSGLSNSCGVAGIMLTTQAVLTDVQRKKSGQMEGGFTADGMPTGMSI